MKIVQIVTQIEAGGAQRVASLLNDGLRSAGHESHLYFLYKKRPAYLESEYSECLSQKRPSVPGWLSIAAQLWSKLQSAKPDVVLTHTHSANAFAAPVAALAGVPVRIAVHHNPVETYPRIARAADHLAFATGVYSNMVTVSGGVTKSFAHHSARYQSRLHRIYNGISAADELSTLHVRARFGIPADHAILVNVGRLASQKNQAVLIKMLQRVPRATLLLVGEGELGEELRKTAAHLGVADRVKFTGELPTSQVAAILQQADLFLLPSRYESFCLAAMEAMNHGLPVVATDLSCLREVLGDEQLFFPINDTNALVRIVLRLLATPGECAAMAVAGKARAQRFSVERMVGEYELLMEEAMLYAAGRRSAAHNLGRLDPLRGVSRINDQL